MKSSWHLHIELDKRIRHMKKRRQWWETHGLIVRECVYLGLGVLIAIVIMIILQAR